MRRIIPALFGTLVGCTGAWFVGHALTMKASAYDVGDNEVPMVVPYKGRLEKDGLPRTGVVNLRFQLLNESNSVVWSETHAVTLDDEGKFEVLLGENGADDFSDAIDDGDDLSIVVSVDDGTGFETLSGKQRFDMTAFALWTRYAGNLEIGGTLSAGGAVDIGGDVVSTGDASVTHATSVVRLGHDHSLNEVSGRFGVAFGDDGGTGAQLVYSSSANTLSLEKATDMSDATDSWSVTRTGAMHVTGPVTAGAGFTVEHTCTIENAADLELVSGNITIGSNTDGQSNRQLLLAGSDDIDWRWQYESSNDKLNLYAEKGTSVTGAFSLTTAGAGYTAYTVDVPDDYDMVVATIPTSTLSNGVDLEQNAANKRYYGDSSCEVGTIYPAYRTDDSDSAMICYCVNGDSSGRGWFCLE